ncbi:MAG: hypothetical protein ACI4DU_01725, partial [Lachnospiraceae bacterium]
SAYIIWNGELNKKFQDPFPQGGYEVHCSQNDADLFCQNKAGIPIYLKILAKNRRLYAKNIILKFHNKLFMVSFTGCPVRIPEQICFHGFVKEKLDEYTEKCISDYADNEIQTEPGLKVHTVHRKRKGNCSFLPSDMRSDYLLRSSFPAGSRYCLRGSYSAGNGSYFAGSGYRFLGSGFLGSGFLGSGFLGSGFLGSGFRMFFEHEYEYETGTRGSYTAGSGFRWKENLFGSGVRLQTSFMTGSGARLRGSFMTGSGVRLRGSFMTGSGTRLPGSFMAGSGTRLPGSDSSKKQIWPQGNDLPGCEKLPKTKIAEVISLSGDSKEEDLLEMKSGEELEKEICEQAMKEIYGVGFLGYGLNLI